MTRKRSRAVPKNRIQTSHAMDYSVLLLVLFLLVFGLVLLYSTSSYRGSMDYADPAYWLKRQGVMAAVGLGAMVVLSKFDYKFFRYRLIQIMMYVGMTGLLIGTTIFAVASHGSKRWISALGRSFQPSEFAKIVLILFLADYIDEHAYEMQRWKGLIKPMIFAALLIIPVGVENMSTSIILLAITFCMLFVANPGYKPFVFVTIIAVAGGVALLYSRAYRLTRITTWLHPEQSEYGEQTLKGLYAIGSGGLFGKGLGQSMQKMILPEAYNDMIFSIICEELGMFGGICVLMLFLVLIWRFMIVSTNARELFGSMIVVGVIVHIGVQVFINIAVATNTMPNTGIPLPFISYGGSSMISILIEMGLVLSVSKRMKIGKSQPIQWGGTG